MDINTSRIHHHSGGGGGDFDLKETFDLLESTNEELVQELKAEINDTLNKNRENWLVYGLFDFYLCTSSQSSRCAEILCGISKEPHDKFLIDKMTEGIKSPSKETKRQTLFFLGMLVSRQPSWLYKITQHSFFKELIRLLKTETDVPVLLTALLSVTMIIPTIPTCIHPYIIDLFEVFGRIATLAKASNMVPKEHVLHLQVGLYSYFHRLYAMYPCNFLSYLRNSFGSSDRRTVFFHTIMPMLEKVKMHPALITGTKEAELSSERWRSKEYHEVVAECSKISLDVYESSFPEEVTPTFAKLSGLEAEDQNLNGSQSTTTLEVWPVESLLNMPTSSLISQAMRSDITSLATYLDDTISTAPPTPLSVVSSQTPSVINKAVSPPETAVEATPENTPLRDKERHHYRLTPTNSSSSAAMHLNFNSNMESIKEKYSKQLNPSTQGTDAPTSYTSVPSSPHPHAPTGTGSYDFSRTTSAPPTPGPGPAPARPLTRRDSIFDTAYTGPVIRRDSLIFQRLQKVQLEQQQHQQGSSQTSDAQTSGSSTVTGPSSGSVSAPPSETAPVKVPMGPSNPPGLHRKASIPAPISIPPTTYEEPAGTGSSSSESFGDREKAFTSSPPTPSSTTRKSHSFSLLDPDLSKITLDEEPAVKECKTTSCAQGGLHMADHRQMMAFAKRVSRLRFHSQCVTSDAGGALPTPGTSPSSTSSAGLLNFRARNIKRSMSLPNIQRRVVVISESEETQVEKSTDTATSSLATEGRENPIADADQSRPEAEGEDMPNEQPYDHLFQQILPTVLSPPVDSRTIPSPHLLLDLYLVRAAAMHNPKGRMDELSLLRGQVALLHAQLLFERHRREAHALRNRRLAGKCRDVLTLQEKNDLLRLEMTNLEKEITYMKQSMVTERGLVHKKEKETEARIAEMDKRLDLYRIQISDLKAEKIQLEDNLARLKDDYSAVLKESDQNKAQLFTLENQFKHLQKNLEINHELKEAYEMSQKEILMLGELLRYHQEVNFPPITSRRDLKEEMNDLRETFEEETRRLRNALESKMSQCVAYAGAIQDMEKKLGKRETIIMEQKLMLEDATKEHAEQLQQRQEKYETVRAENHRLELELMNLQHQLTMKAYSTRTSRGRIASSPSNGEMSPTGNSNHSDVDSAASAAGYQVSPDRNACFFGSPQMDLPLEELKDLQQVLEQEEEPLSPSTSTNNHDQDNRYT